MNDSGRRPGGVTPRAPDALLAVSAVAGKTPRAPTTAAGPFFRPPDPSGGSRGTGQATPAISRASVPARRAAIRSSRVKPAGASVRVVTPASA